ncbi:MAG: flagellar protein FlgN [Gammaproteobacteria bacterium]|nr:flagellar protein FlgN [Gammaproteobacteria bacterium]
MIDFLQTANLLRGLIAHADALVAVLDQETQALIEGDLSAMAAAAAAKDALSQKLDSGQRELSAHLQDQSLAGAIAAAGDVARAECEPLHNLLKARLADCRHRNAVNGKVVHRSRQSIAELARILSGTDADPIYTANGKKRSVHDGHALAHA